MNNIDRFDIEIMYNLYDNSMISPLASLKIKDIISKCEDKSTYYTYVNRVKKLIGLKMIKEGFKSGNAKCYYITEKGINYLEQKVLSVEIGGNYNE